MHMFIIKYNTLMKIDMMRTIKHPNIVAFHDLIAEKDFIYLIE
jgi:hypothetical protein